ncbi:MAG: hypothetical protein LBT09_14465 [Planctomycetaceae bacterium]|nr:hypothetical protein [Planctomycetaceae bacterium]
MLVETIAIKSTASRRDAILVKPMIDVDLPTFRPYGTRCFSWTLFSTNISSLRDEIFFMDIIFSPLLLCDFFSGV